MKTPTKFICQWSLEIIFGKQKQAVDILRRWGEEKSRSSGFKNSHRRLMNGYIGISPSLIVDEYEFDSMDEFEKALADMRQPQFRKFSEELAPFIVSGSQKWTIFAVV